MIKIGGSYAGMVILGFNVQKKETLLIIHVLTMTETELKCLAKLKEYGIVTLGTLLVAIGIHFFKFPNNFSTGGVSGMAVILGAIVPDISAGTFVLIINSILLLLGFAFLGTSVGVKTVYGSMLLSLALFAFEMLCPMTTPLTNQPLLDLAFEVGIPAVGSALLFNTGASTGGTDITAMILKKRTHLNIGKALFFVDIIITLPIFFVFGVTTGLLSTAGLLLRTLIIDNVIENLNLSKYFTIITNHPVEINDYINNSLHKGATVCNCRGVFSNDEKALILTVINRSQSIMLRDYIKSVDKNAFMVISNTSNIIGKGFREVI